MFDIDTLIKSQGLYRTAYPNGYQFVWRLLTLKEYQVFRVLRDNQILLETSVHLSVFERCYLGNPDLISENIPIGLLASIGHLIMYLSGDCDGETVANDIALVRSFYPAASVQEHMKRVVLTAFPSYTLEDVDSWNRPELIRRFVLSEHILSYRVGTQPLDLSTIGKSDESDNIKPAEHKIDFEQEANAQWSALGPMAYYDTVEEEHNKTKQVKLNTEQARKLDKRKTR